MSSNIQVLASVVPLVNTCKGRRVLVQQLARKRIIGGVVRLTHCFLNILLPQYFKKSFSEKKKYTQVLLETHIFLGADFFVRPARAANWKGGVATCFKKGVLHRTKHLMGGRGPLWVHMEISLVYWDPESTTGVFQSSVVWGCRWASSWVNIPNSS